MKKKTAQKLQLGKIKISSLSGPKVAIQKRLTADPDNPCDPIHTMFTCRTI
ncbi:hypothetical protein [Chitinophaga rupis]|uniref:hypothetical protein n=1 Tax=Chitinophaga rupis TaxID=573321 RepID=UPI0012DE34CD|nr:hypothetical protein [Chitinophaga rupis]